MVSHNMNLISKYCSRVLWMDKGVPRMLDTPEIVIPLYQQSFETSKTT